MNITKRDYFIKKLLYQSGHRGCKETDIILGKFAKDTIYNMNDVELKIFEEILQLPDLDIYNWYNKTQDIPMNHMSEMLVQIVNNRL